jgi:glycosyltransferase involved in cell wall biosynthesis
MVGRITPWKGQHVFIEAFARAFADGDERGLIVGDALFADSGGPEAAYAAGLRHQAEHLGVADRLTFTGFVDDVPSLLATVDLVVHASVEPEPFGLVVIEAMAAGRALIASAAGGPLEIVDDGVDGVLVAPGDVAALADAMRALADDPDRRAALGAAARRAILDRAHHHVGAGYRPEDVARSVATAWADAAAHRRRRRRARDVAAAARQ